MKYTLRCVNPTFTFTTSDLWIRTERGIEQRDGGATYEDINAAHYHASKCCQCSTCYYAVDEVP